MTNLIEERYLFDFDADAAVRNVAALATEVERLDKSTAALRASSKLTAAQLDQLGKEEKQLAAASAQLGTILKQEVTSLDGINAKRNLLKGALAGLTKGTKEYVAVLKELDKLEKKVADGTAAVAKSSGGFLSIVKGGLAVLATQQILSKVIEVGRAALEASAKKQQQEAALLNALRGRADVQERLLAQAAEVENTTLFGGGDVVDIQTYLATLGFTEKQIRLNVEASKQLSAVTGGSLAQSAKTLVDAYNGQIGALKKVVPEVSKLKNAQLQAGAASELIAKKFKGAAEALQTGVVGQLNQIKDSLGSFQTDLGDVIISAQARNLAALSAVVGDSNDGTATAFQKVKTLALDAVDFILSLPAYFLASLNGFVEATGKSLQIRIDAIKIGLLEAKSFGQGLLNSIGVDNEKSIAETEARIRELRTNRRKEMLFSFAENFQLGAREILKDAGAFKSALTKLPKIPPFDPVDPKKTKESVGVIAGSLADLERQLGKLKEQLSKTVKADDVGSLRSFLAKIKVLEEKVEAAKALQARLAAPVFGNAPQIPGADLVLTVEQATKTAAQLEEIAKSTQEGLSTIQEGYLNERLAELNRAETAELSNARLSKAKRLEIEKDYARERERLEIDVNQSLANKDLQAQQLLLLQLADTRRKQQEILRKAVTPQERSKAAGDVDDTAKQEAATKARIAELKKQLSELAGKKVKIDIEIDEDKRAKLQETLKAIGEGIVNVAQELASALQSLYDAQAAAAERAVTRQQSALEKMLANSEDFNAQQIEIERDRLDKLEREQRAAQERARATQIAALTANSIVAISKAAAEGGVAAPFTIAATLIALIAGIAQARAAAQSAFYEGTDYLQLNGNRPGRDTIPIRANEGEAIVATATNKKYHPTIKAVRRHDIPADVLNGFVEAWRSGSVANDGDGFYFKNSPGRNLPGALGAARFGATASGQGVAIQFQTKQIEMRQDQQTGLLSQILEETRQGRRSTKRQAASANRHATFAERFK